MNIIQKPAERDDSVGCRKCHIGIGTAATHFWIGVLHRRFRERDHELRIDCIEITKSLLSDSRLDVLAKGSQLNVRQF